ncbi:tyrosine-type recombinase/integrase [Runella limosa]|uniref:tyrosine-type recombinase/integrase n=1 Tax=Runella limosa TaxID=370978 RepID=UPI00041C0CF9|nr:site-specific integrase [Runella limosa]
MKIGIRFKMRQKRGANAQTLHYLYCTIRVDGVQCSPFTTSIATTKSSWDSKRQLIKGYDEKVRLQNEQLNQIRDDIMGLYNDCRKQGKHVTPDKLKSLYVDKEQFTPQTLLAYYTKYVEQEKMGRCRSSTITIWKTRYNKVKEYITQELKVKDIGLSEITPKFLTRLRNYLTTKAKRKYSQTSATYMIQTIRAVLDYAVIEEVLPYNPTSSLKLIYSPKKPMKYLSEHEVQALSNYQGYKKGVKVVVDMFLIQCYTGMAYNELIALNKSNIVNNGGIDMIVIYRGKTLEICKIPLLAPAKVLLEKYNYKLPKVRNDRMNKLIKKAAKQAELERWSIITTHVGRKTCGCYLLNAGVRMEVVSAILGHKSIKTTERYYVELLTSSVSNELKRTGLI